MKLAAIDHALGTLRGYHSYFAEGDQAAHPNFKAPGFNGRCWGILKAYHLALAPFADPANWSQDDWGILTFQGDEADLQAARDALEME